MRIAARSCRSVVDLAGVVLGVVDKLRDGRRRKILRRGEKERGNVDQSHHRHHIALVVDRYRSGGKDRRNGVRGNVINHQVQTVAARAHQFLDRDEAVGARLVLHHESHAERFLELVRQYARDDIGRAAGREWHDNATLFEFHSCAREGAPASTSEVNATITDVIALMTPLADSSMWQGPSSRSATDVPAGPQARTAA